MQFVFDEWKAAQAVAYLLHRHGRPMPSAKLARLLYLVDRRGFVETEYPTTGDRFVAMPDGPALARIPDLIAGTRRDADSSWSAFVSPFPDGCVTLGPRDEDRLSDYDRELIGGVLDEFGAMDEEALAVHMRDLPEWSAPASSCADIDPRVILRTAGFTEDAIVAVESDVADVHWIRTRYVADSSL